MQYFCISCDALCLTTGNDLKWPLNCVNYYTLSSVPDKDYLYFDLSIVRPSKEPGWLEGTLNGRTGLVPENYVEPIT